MNVSNKTNDFLLKWSKRDFLGKGGFGEVRIDFLIKIFKNKFNFNTKVHKVWLEDGSFAAMKELNLHPFDEKKAQSDYNKIENEIKLK